MAGTSAFFDLFGASGGLDSRELAAAEDLSVADRLLAKDLFAFAVGSGDVDGRGALLDGATLSLVGYGLWLLLLVVHAGAVPGGGA